MPEKPILFSGPMIRAILAGRKTQTRRIVQHQNDGPYHGVTDGEPWWMDEAGQPHRTLCPYGQPGDRLWVRENFYIDTHPDGPLPKTQAPIEMHDIYYPADAVSGRNWCCQLIPECSCAEFGKPRIRLSIHMPRWSSRITLGLTDVRCERLQEISEADAKAEGVERYRSEFAEGTYRSAFSHLWDSINAKRGFPWPSNPWVWVLSFRVIEPAARAGGAQC